MSDAKIEVKLNPNFTSGGTAGYVTWIRLNQLLHDAGELHDNENINGFKADKDGITFYVDTK